MDTRFPPEYPPRGFHIQGPNSHGIPKYAGKLRNIPIIVQMMNLVASKHQRHMETGAESSGQFG